MSEDTTERFYEKCLEAGPMAHFAATMGNKARFKGGGGPSAEQRAQAREQRKLIKQQRQQLKEQRAKAEEERAKIESERKRKEEARKRGLRGRRSLISGSELGEDEKLG